MVEAMGFEPMTSWSRTKRATKLHHASKYVLDYFTIVALVVQGKNYEKKLRRNPELINDFTSS